MNQFINLAELTAPQGVLSLDLPAFFGDYRATDLEEQYRTGNVSEVAENLVREIRSHFDFAYDGVERSSTTDRPRLKLPARVRQPHRRFPQAEL